MTECNFRELGIDYDAIPPDLDDREDPALAVNISGKIVPENIEIIEVCQDSEHINIVYLLVDVHGVFNYTPKLIVSYLDDNDTTQEVDASSGLIFNYRGNPNSIQSIPFSTACGSETIIFAYDLALFIPNFVTLYKMTLSLTLYGEFDISRFDFLQDFDDINVGIFNSENPVKSIVFTKGITAKPYKLYFDSDTGELKLQFFTVGDNKCICNITCANITYEDQDLKPCEDEIQEVTVNTNALIGTTTSVDIAIRDSLGNISDLSYLLVLGITPIAPSAIWQSSPYRVEVSPHFMTDIFEQIDGNKIQYQIWKYVNNIGSSKMVVDWTTKFFKEFVDIDVHSGNTYGYSVRFRGEFQEVSEFSSWTVIEIP